MMCLQFTLICIPVYVLLLLKKCSVFKVLVSVA